MPTEWTYGRVPIKLCLWMYQFEFQIIFMSYENYFSFDIFPLKDEKAILSSRPHEAGWSGSPGGKFPHMALSLLLSGYGPLIPES